MKSWSLALYGPSGLLGTFESGETQFVLGSEEAADVWPLQGEGVAARHAWVYLGDGRLQVEDLGGGTLVNGHAIEGRVEVEYPASVQVGDVTLVVEVQGVLREEVPVESTEVTIPQRGTRQRGDRQTAASLAVTIPQRVSTNRGSSTDVTIPQRPRHEAEARQAGNAAEATAQNKAPLSGEYTLVREIARGGMGQIYFGEDPQLKRQVAVKVSRVAQGREDPRFSKEAEVLAHLAHPNIVPIYNIGVDSQSRPFYSMKLVKGRTLQAVLNALREGDAAVMKEYTRAALLTVFRKVCDALAFAHSKGVLHRDLKPENIMVGEYGEVLVMDWGLAKILGGKEDVATGKSPVKDTGDYGMTLEGEVMGTPQYMSPEQAEGMVAELDVRSDIYSLGGILYALLTLRPPIAGTTLEEVLTKVKKGEISSMVTKRGSQRDVAVGAPSAMGVEIPEALQAVTLKAMATDRNKRYASVDVFAGDIEAYQNGFATSAEEAGAWKRVKLWVGRNKVLAGAVAVLVVVVSGFTARVVQKGREASEALQSLRETAPTFAVRAQDALREGRFEEALKAATFAVKLESQSGDYRALRGNILQVLVRWSDAVAEYQTAVQLGAKVEAQENLVLTEALLARAKSGGEANAKVALFEALNTQGRQYEAMEFGKGLGDFWKEQRKDLSAIPELVRRLEAKMLPVPGTKILLSKTEFTVGEWKLYLRAEGLPDWTQPSKDFEKNDEHPVVNVSWNDAKTFCDWLSLKTGKQWRLPTNLEWEAAVGTGIHPWGDYYPPKWDDGNYAVAQDAKDAKEGKNDPQGIGLDGIKGTAPVGSFKPNALGFYDLGGNVWEYMWDGLDEKTGNLVMRGGAWNNFYLFCRAAHRESYSPGRPFNKRADAGFRLAISSVP